LEPAAVTLYSLLNGSFTRLHVHRTCPETSPRSGNPRITEPLTQAAIENTFSRLCTLVAVVTRLRRLRLWSSRVCNFTDMHLTCKLPALKPRRQEQQSGPYHWTEGQPLCRIPRTRNCLRL